MRLRIAAQVRQSGACPELTPFGPRSAGQILRPATILGRPYEAGCADLRGGLQQLDCLIHLDAAALFDGAVEGELAAEALHDVL